jgi:ribosomal protein S18 acetylase RimI-like enzyme
MFALYRRVFSEHISRIWGWSEDWQVADFRKGLAQANCQIIERDGRRIGFVRSKGASTLELQLLALAPEYQCRGLGTAVIQSLQRVCTRIELKVFITNALAKQFYLRLGFDEVGTCQRFRDSGSVNSMKEGP